MGKQKLEQQGWLTFAQNSDTVNYVNQAYLLALSIKNTCTINSFAVVVDTESAKTITDKQRKVFDHIITVPRQENPFALECSVFQLTPFKETFKVESDMLIPRNLDHWWAGCRDHDVLLTNSVRDYQGRVSNNRYYRKFFDANNLVDIYNGFMYIRYSHASMGFFALAHNIMENWQHVSNAILDYNVYDIPDTDVIFGITATIWNQGRSNLGNANATKEHETNREDREDALTKRPYNAISYPTFTHMKGAINGWKPNMDWRDAVPWTLTNELDLIVGGYAQNYPFHYYQKDFCTEELIQRYEQNRTT
jgi:hypothetical protein